MSNPTFSAFSSLNRQLKGAERNHGVDHSTAFGCYRNIIRLARARSMTRHRERILEVGRCYQRLRKRFIAQVAAIIGFIGLLLLCAWLMFPPVTFDSADSIGSWLKQYETAQLLKKVLSMIGDSGRTDQNGQPLSLAEAIRLAAKAKLVNEIPKMRPNASKGTGRVALRCPAWLAACDQNSLLPPVDALNLELDRVIEAAMSVLPKYGDCRNLGAVIGGFEKTFVGRQSALGAKVRVDRAASLCFEKIGDTRSAILHQQTAFCAASALGQSEEAFKSLLHLTRIESKAEQLNRARSWIACGQIFADRYRVQKGINKTSIGHQINLGYAYSTDLGDDNKGIALFERALSEVQSLLLVSDAGIRLDLFDSLSTVQLNLIEGYLIVGRYRDFDRIYQEITSNPALDHSQRLLIFGFKTIRYLMVRDYRTAYLAMDDFKRRYSEFSEIFTGTWAWDSFDRWLASQPHEDQKILRHIQTIRSLMASGETHKRWSDLVKLHRWLEVRT